MLSPVWAGTRVAQLSSDDSVLAALLLVEKTWTDTLAHNGYASADEARVMQELVAERGAFPELAQDQLSTSAVVGGNPVIPLLAAIRSVLDERGTEVPSLHRGATSQDVMDTALMVVSRQVIEDVIHEAWRVCQYLAELTDQHRRTHCVARTLTQHALPSSFGMRTATWLDGLVVATQELRNAAEELPLQWGGAVGTQAGLSDAVGAEGAAILTSELADRLGLHNPGRPWHVQRYPVLRLGGALAGLVAAVTKTATDVLTLQRPEIAEVSEPHSSGRGGSSAMPHKENPVLSVLIRSAGLQAPGHLATLHHSAATSNDERPDGAWQAEWPALRELLRLAGGAITHAAELFQGLSVDAAQMQGNLDAAGPWLYSERIVTALQGEHPQGKTGIQQAIREAAAGQEDLVGRLHAEFAEEAVSPDELESRLAEAMDPAGSLGRAEDFIETALQAYREARR